MFRKRIRQVVSVTIALLLTFGHYGNTKVKAEDDIVVSNGITFNKTTQTILSGGNPNLPDEIDGVIVKHIADRAFYKKYYTKIVLPSHIETIGDEAFFILNSGNSNSAIGEVILPESLTKIGKSAFTGAGIQKLTIPKGVTEIAERAFARNSLTDLTITEGVKVVGVGAFASNSYDDITRSINSLTIPNSVTRIEDGAFNLTGIKEIVLSKNLNYIGKGAFDSCFLKSLTMPDSVTEIGEDSFDNNSLSSLKLSNKLKVIPKSAFRFNRLTSLVIPDSVEIIEDSAFEWAFDSFSMEANNSYQYQPQEVILSKNIRKIGPRAFSGNGLMEIELPASLETMSEDAFSEQLILVLNWAIIDQGYRKLHETSDLFKKHDISNYELTYDSDAVYNAATGNMENGRTFSFSRMLKDNIKISGDILGDYTYTPLGYSVKFYDIDDQLFHESVAFVDWRSIVNNPEELKQNWLEKTGRMPEAPVVEGYKFIKWDKDLTVVTESMNVHPIYEKLNKVVFLDKDGKQLKSEYVDTGESATPPTAPIEDGYRYIGWDKAYTNIQGDVTIQAKYVKTWNVNFYDKEKKQLSETQIIDDQGRAKAPQTKEVKGYTFRGWDKAFNKVTSDLNIYAKYEKKNYQVTFKDMKGNTIKTEQVKYGEDATAPTIPTEEGYRYIGWDKDYIKVEEDLVVQARYVKTWKVNFYDQEKKQLGKTQLIDDQGKAIAPKTKEVKGYTFTGWNQTYDKVTSDLNIYAKYEKKNYQVLFVDYDDRLLKEDIVAYQENATAPSKPTREGYQFIGWDKDYNNITENMIVKAKYEKVIAGKEKPNKKEEDKKQDSKKDIDTSDQSNTILFLVLFMISGGYLVNRKRNKAS